MLPGLDYDFAHVLAACARGELEDELLLRPLPLAKLAALAPEPSPAEPYGRRVLHRSAHGEVLLVRFARDIFCAPHGHGAARAVLCVLQGELFEQRWAFDGQRLQLKQKRSARAPARLHVPEHTIHNTKGSPGALALHFYVPAITGMQVYDEAERRTLTVRDDCGAWVPSDPALVLTSEPWA